MRFSTLSLERYGRFEGCELSFRDGQPDLHVVYGANEAGKTTSLSAVSDLLFGFPTRSPYNFRFDYSLLRVGAVLEESGTSLACRRRKSGPSTLVDGNDNPVDDGLLLGMLRGQTRETFRLSFSLDQDGLRRGGRAMVEAKNDVGQALFAAGSGLTGIAEELARIDEEADAIWGKRAKASRTYTQAERELETSLRAIRDDGLKPKEWNDARKAMELAREKLDDLEAQRDALLLESQKAERVRRVAGSVRLRKDLLARLAIGVAPIELAIHVELAAEAAMVDAETAARHSAVAEKLLQELEERSKQLVADPDVIDQADAIEELVVESGAVSKAAKDFERLERELAIADTELAGHRTAASTAVGRSLASATIVALRELARAHADDAAALTQIAESRSGLDERRAPLAARLEQDVADDSLADLVDAVDAGRRLGADADNRCSKARVAAKDAADAVVTAIARLKPWIGGVEELRALPPVGQAEIAKTKIAWNEYAGTLADEEDAAHRSNEEAAKIELQIAALPSGSAVSEEALTEGRTARAKKWAPIRAHIVEAVPLEDSLSAAAEMETAITGSDALADHRFALADASGRLATLEASRDNHKLDAKQACERAAIAATRLESLKRDWKARLDVLQIPNLEPVQLETWLEGRTSVLDDEDARARKAEEAYELDSNRTAIIARLRHELGEDIEAAAGNLADILVRAERLRSLRESKVEQARADRQTLDQIDIDIAAQEKRSSVIAARAAPRSADWTRLLGDSEIDLDIARADARLTAIDKVRQSIEQIDGLKLRIEGICRDTERFGAKLMALSEILDVSEVDDAERIKSLRTRLQHGQTAERLLDEVAKDVAKRTAEKDSAAATFAAAMEVVAPLYEETGSADPVGLSQAIANSRAVRRDRAALAEVETQIVRDGDGLALEALVSIVEESDPDQLLARTETMARELSTLNAAISDAANTHGNAGRAFENLEGEPGAAANAASDAEQARAEMAVQAEAYILKRTQALTLRWAIEEYRQRHQDPLLVRASALFSTLTLGRYSALRVELDGSAPRLLGITDDGRSAVDVTGMSEGTTDQLFLSLRLAAVEQSVAAGVRLPFLADDLFVNFDDDRSEAGFRVLAELAKKTQVLFFTHHVHLAEIAKKVVGVDAYSECALE